MMRPLKMSSQRKRELRVLAHRMNQQNIIPVPVIQELLECFDVVITPEETAFLLQMGTQPLTYHQAASLSTLPEEAFAPFFETLLKKGFVWATYSENEVEHFRLAPILVGWFEIYLSDGAETPDKQEFAQRFDRLVRSMGKLNVFPLRNVVNYVFLRKLKAITRIVTTRGTHKTVHIDVQQKLEVPVTKVYPTQSVFELIEKYGSKNQIALVHCFCRQWRKMAGDPCRFQFPSESCIIIGHLTRYVVNYGIGRYISREHALEVIQEVREKGAVHQVFHEREDLNLPEMGICNCCWDCCGVLGSYNRGLMPLRLKSYYAAYISDPSSCTGCGTCVKYCPVNAISINENTAHIDMAKCIGCGQCKLHCPQKVITLQFQEREVILPLLKKSEARIRLIKKE